MISSMEKKIETHTYQKRNQETEPESSRSLTPPTPPDLGITMSPPQAFFPIAEDGSLLPFSTQTCRTTGDIYHLYISGIKPISRDEPQPESRGVALPPVSSFDPETLQQKMQTTSYVSVLRQLRLEDEDLP